LGVVLFDLDGGALGSVGEGKDTRIVSFALPSVASSDLLREELDFATAVLLPLPPLLALSVEERLLRDFPNEKLVYDGESGGEFGGISFLVDAGGPLVEGCG
jgi:hypothetical protein